ncbi:hypothetical protein D9M70_528810 [compost metagenome]
MTYPEARQQRENAVMAIGGRNADAQFAAGFQLLAHDFALGFDQLGQRLAALLEVGASPFGEADAAGGAHEQAGAQAFLQP